MANLLPRWDTDNVDSLEPFADVRLIVVDLDGTLIPADLLAKIKELRGSLSSYRYKVALTLATGRTFAGVQPLLEKISLAKGIPLILYNGSVIVTNGTCRLLKRQTISIGSLTTILEICVKRGACCLAYFYEEPWFVQQRRGRNEHVVAWGQKSRTFREFNNMQVHWQKSRALKRASEPSSILIDISNVQGEVQAIDQELAELTEISATRSGASYIEIRPHGSDKGAALEFVAGKYGFQRNEVLALGDNDNDAEMLGWAGIGVSISTASERALAESDYVCRHGVFEGAVEVLRLVKHAKHYFYTPKRSGKDFHEDEPHRKLA